MPLILFPVLIILFIVSLFSSPRFSPVPYFPTNKKDIPLIIKALGLKNNQTIIDLGAGDGIVIFEAAIISLQQKLNTQFIAVEINPVLVIILFVSRLFHPNRKNIKIIWGDFFKVTMQQFNNITIYLYVSPWLIDKLIKNLKLKTKNFSLVSYMYSSKLLKDSQKIIKGKNKIFIY